MASDLGFLHTLKARCRCRCRCCRCCPGAVPAGPGAHCPPSAVSRCRRPVGTYPGCFGEPRSGSLQGDTQRSSLWLLPPSGEGILCLEQVAQETLGPSVTPLSEARASPSASPHLPPRAPGDKGALQVCQGQAGLLGTPRLTCFHVSLSPGGCWDWEVTFSRAPGTGSGGVRKKILVSRL